MVLFLREIRCLRSSFIMCCKRLLLEAIRGAKEVQLFANYVTFRCNPPLSQLEIVKVGSTIAERVSLEAK